MSGASSPTDLKDAIMYLYRLVYNREILHCQHFNAGLTEALKQHVDPNMKRAVAGIVSDHIQLVGRKMSETIMDFHNSSIQELPGMPGSGGPPQRMPITVHTVKCTIRLLFPDPNVYQQIYQYIDYALENFKLASSSQK